MAPARDTEPVAAALQALAALYAIEVRLDYDGKLQLHASIVPKENKPAKKAKKASNKVLA